MNYATFFTQATGHPPYGWQGRLACGDAYRPESTETQDTGTACTSRLIDIPTGLGKTAGVVLAWLWNRQVSANDENAPPWPRRLVYCLPMRTLVEQTASEAESWLGNLWRHANELNLAPKFIKELRWIVGAPANATPSSFNPQPSTFKSPVILMGGQDQSPAKRDWDLYPEKPAILIGTQDMLLSRALNRGYGAGRARWPMHFALLNNDSLWVMDEVQLMANGLSTTLQLQAWRESLGTKERPESIQATAKPSTVLPTHTWWMSATMAEHWFETAVDWRTLNLNGELAPEKLWKERIEIPKPDYEKYSIFKVQKSKYLACLTSELKKDSNGEKELNIKEYVHSVVDFIVTEENRKSKKFNVDTAEIPELCTLLVVNTVERAVAIYNKIKDQTPFNQNNILLLHSRFRGAERRQWHSHIKAFEMGAYPEEERVPIDQQYTVDGPRLIIATQVIEAGVDLSAPILYTERCPMASLIQRLGRCARRASETGKVYILPMNVDEATAKPYTKEELEAWQP